MELTGFAASSALFASAIVTNGKRTVLSARPRLLSANFIAGIRSCRDAALAPGDSLALTFGGSRSLNEITLDQVRRFAGVARVPMNPVWAIVRATVERTAEGWNALPA